MARLLKLSLVLLLVACLFLGLLHGSRKSSSKHASSSSSSSSASSSSSSSPSLFGRLMTAIFPNVQSALAADVQPAQGGSRCGKTGTSAGQVVQGQVGLLVTIFGTVLMDLASFVAIAVLWTGAYYLWPMVTYAHVSASSQTGPGQPGGDGQVLARRSQWRLVEAFGLDLYWKKVMLSLLAGGLTCLTEPFLVPGLIGIWFHANAEQFVITEPAASSKGSSSSASSPIAIQPAATYLKTSPVVKVIRYVYVFLFYLSSLVVLAYLAEAVSNNPTLVRWFRDLMLLRNGFFLLVCLLLLIFKIGLASIRSSSLL